ncbi:MAG: hypothetical protein J4O14_00265 [Chloroflexi bacterium]|nr:hypothetical protein [Chloroflexota bacterium]MCH8200805.1 hypothetical protein [Chloroflexota bacterium]MCI0782714.1 hypothetical protein [Chloroflexota bacterium]MCI0814474.1 hypothetical protein [Chloroflexota bacterium]MCI0816686.1 hypothetical protein [Chloroflexota bacterium]
MVVLAAVLFLVGIVLALNAAGSAIRRRHALYPRGLPFVVAAAGAGLVFTGGLLVVVFAII